VTPTHRYNCTPRVDVGGDFFYAELSSALFGSDQQ